MELPFVYGKLTHEVEFTNREAETEQLVRNFMSGINTTLISPRRWGKSSLVSHAAKRACKQDKKLKVCFIDTFSVRNEQEFYNLYAKQVIKTSSSKWDDIHANIGKYLGKFIPKISVSPAKDIDFSLSLDWEAVSQDPLDILNLPQRIAEQTGQKWVMCIDEFQSIADFKESVAFQKRLRSVWQLHQHVGYCLYGSKRHMMLDIFSNTQMPFYKFGDIIFLEKIKEKDWIPFIVKRFKDTGKTISKTNAAYIAQLAENHPYYVQQLAQQVWLRTSTECTIPIIDNAMEGITLQLSLLFQELTNTFTSVQANFLKALINNEAQLTSAKTIKKYNLGTSAGALKAKMALANKDVIDIIGNEISILDPIFKHWYTITNKTIEV